MRQHPILFNADMVRAVLDGRKTQTRRVIKPQPTKRDNPNWVDAGEASFCNGTHEKAAKCEDNSVIKSPYGGPGHRLWVRETTAEDVIGSQSHTRYLADNHWSAIDWQYPRPVCPSIHMPRWASRILLEVTNVRVERVQDISDDDAKAEGLKCLTKDGGITYKYGIPELDGWPGPTGWEWHEWEVSPYMAFAKLWDSINGKKPGRSWRANPWIWAIDFEVVKWEK